MVPPPWQGRNGERGELWPPMGHGSTKYKLSCIVPYSNNSLGIEKETGPLAAQEEGENSRLGAAGAPPAQPPRPSGNLSPYVEHKGRCRKAGLVRERKGKGRGY